MGSQRVSIDVKYCDGCQTLKEYQEDVLVTACSSTDEFINPELYNQMIDRLKIIRTFGDNDTVSPRAPDGVQNLKNKKSLSLIELDYWNDIAPHVEKSKAQKGDVLYGTYFDDLKTAVNEYKIPSTRYWTCYGEGTTDCCDCYGQCSCYSGGGGGGGDTGGGDTGGGDTPTPCTCQGECGSYGNCGQTSWCEEGCGGCDKVAEGLCAPALENQYGQ